MDQKKLLIAGGGYADVPLILAAQKLGYYVITSGNRDEDLGHLYSDEYQKADFSDKEKMLELALKLKIDAICPCCNDFSASSCAYIAEQMGLPGHDPLQTVEILHHKDNYRMFATTNDILSPKAESFSDSVSALDAIHGFKFPVIVKPVDLTGGKGVSKVNSLNEAKRAIENAFELSKAKRIVIEEFIEGSNHGFSSFLRDGKIVFYFVDNEHYYLNKYMVSGASTHTHVPNEAIDFLISQSEKIASKLNLVDGILHIQFILKETIPYIIEICRRPPGDLYIDLVKHATGIDYATYIIRAFTGASIDDLSHKTPEGFYTRHCVMTDRRGKIHEVIYEKMIQNKIVEKFMWWKRGDEIVDFLTYKAGIVFLKYESQEEMNDITSRINSLIRIEFEQ